MSADQFIEIIIIGSWGWRKRLWVAAWGMGNDGETPTDRPKQT